jgi:hypothetical protein
MATAKKRPLPTEIELDEIENPLQDQCFVCGITYEEFPSGETYQSVYDMLWSGDEDPDTWQFKRRNTILGKWHQIKQMDWKYHLDQCQENEDKGAEFEPVYHDQFIDY